MLSTPPVPPQSVRQKSVKHGLGGGGLGGLGGLGVGHGTFSVGAHQTFAIGGQKMLSGGQMVLKKSGLALP